MPLLPALSVFRDEMSFFKFIGIVVLVYYGVMDIILYFTYMQTDLVESSKGATADEMFSPFT
jgi:hypothetical protein